MGFVTTGGTTFVEPNLVGLRPDPFLGAKLSGWFIVLSLSLIAKGA